jgi:hypothetical protein
MRKSELNDICTVAVTTAADAQTVNNTNQVSTIQSWLSMDALSQITSTTRYKGYVSWHRML